jgi:hypothetical protein
MPSQIAFFRRIESIERGLGIRIVSHARRLSVALQNPIQLPSGIAFWPSGAGLPFIRTVHHLQFATFRTQSHAKLKPVLFRLSLAHAAANFLHRFVPYSS